MEGVNAKVAIVTGGATVIGAAVVRAFRAAGASVAIADIDVEGGEAVAVELGDGVLFSETDIRSDESIARFVAAPAASFGGIDFLVNLACSYVDDALESSRDDWLESLNVNVASAAMLAKAVRPQMISRGGGAIVNFTSISANVAQTAAARGRARAFRLPARAAVRGGRPCDRDRRGRELRDLRG